MKTFCHSTAVSYLDDLKELHWFDCDVKLNDAVVIAAADEFAVNTTCGLDDPRRFVDGEEATVEGRLFENAKPQRRDRRPVVLVGEPEAADEVADDLARCHLLENVILEDVAGRCQTDAA